MIVVAGEVCAERLAGGQVRFFKRELCICPDGCVDGKSVSRGFLEQVRLRGSEPARYAFLDARVPLSCPDGLSERPAEIARHPVAEKADRTRRFYAQFMAWGW